MLLLAGPQQLALSTLSLGSKVGGEEGSKEETGTALEEMTDCTDR